jgi:hypothetical protein
MVNASVGHETAGGEVVVHGAVGQPGITNLSANNVAIWSVGQILINFRPPNTNTFPISAVKCMHVKKLFTL